MTATGLERGDQVRAICPACAAEGTHEVLKAADRATVECRSCGHVHQVAVRRPPTEDVRVVVSSGGESLRTTASIPVDERLMVGEEFVAETADGPIGVRITSLERRDDERVDVADAADVRTVWTRAVDNVGVNLTVHPADGRREGTVGETQYLPGDEEFEVGEPIPHRDGDARIERILLRDDTVRDGPHVLDAPGDTAPAKDVKRVFARARSGDPWRSPWE